MSSIFKRQNYFCYSHTCLYGDPYCSAVDPVTFHVCYPFQYTFLELALYATFLLFLSVWMTAIS